MQGRRGNDQDETLHQALHAKEVITPLSGTERFRRERSSCSFRGHTISLGSGGRYRYGVSVLGGMERRAGYRFWEAGGCAIAWVRHCATLSHAHWQALALALLNSMHLAYMSN